MLFKNLLQSLALVGTAVANPVLRSTFPQGSILSVRDDEYVCSKGNCSGVCGGNDTETLSNPRFAFASEPAVLPIAAEGNKLFSRDINRPEEGQLDSWFAEQYASDSMNNMGYGKEGAWDDFTARYWELGDSAITMGIKGLYGCTAVVITSSNGIFMSHSWENPDFIGAAQGMTGPFDTYTIGGLQSILPDQGFNKEEQPELQAVIMTKWDNRRENYVKYPDQIDQVKNTISEIVPGLSADDIKVVAYYATHDSSMDLQTATGKLIAQYDPAAEEGKAGVDVWAGSLRDESTGDGIPAEENNTPILEARW